MAKEESEFQKLLSEAPAAPDPDTLTLIGFLGRTADPARFVLTLPDGRSETLEVAAVKSAKKMASAIGQSVVELELDAKRVPELMRGGFKSGPDLPPWTVVKRPQDEPGSHPAIEVGGLRQVEAYAPFVAAPHQAHPGTIAALSHPSHRTQSHLHVKPPQRDQQMPPKQPYQDGTNANNPNALDITGNGGFDVITYPDGNPTYPTYHYYYPS